MTKITAAEFGQRINESPSIVRAWPFGDLPFHSNLPRRGSAAGAEGARLLIGKVFKVADDGRVTLQTSAVPQALRAVYVEPTYVDSWRRLANLQLALGVSPGIAPLPIAALHYAVDEVLAVEQPFTDVHALYNPPLEGELGYAHGAVVDGPYAIPGWNALCLDTTGKQPMMLSLAPDAAALTADRQTISHLHTGDVVRTRLLPGPQEGSFRAGDLYRIEQPLPERPFT